MGCVEMIGEWGALQELSFLLLLSQLTDGTRKEVISSTGWRLRFKPNHYHSQESGSDTLYKVSGSQVKNPGGEDKL